MSTARCAFRQAAAADLREYAATLDVKPADAFDLWTHMRTIYSSGDEAHRAARAVLDLGWRKTIGAA